MEADTGRASPSASGAAGRDPASHRVTPSREEDLPKEVRANLAALDSQFAWADRFVIPLKKKD